MELKLALKVDDLDNVATIFANGIVNGMEVEIRDKSVLSFTPALCAAMQCALCVKLLAGKPVETGTVYYFDLLHQEFETIPL